MPAFLVILALTGGYTLMYAGVKDCGIGGIFRGKCCKGGDCGDIGAATGPAAPPKKPPKQRHP